jgi:hypothetical protein
MFMAFPLYCHTNYITTTLDHSLISQKRTEQIKRYCLLADCTTDIAVELDGPSYIKNTHQNIYLIYNKKGRKFST